MAKTHKQLQEEAELLGIAKNQSAEKLIAAIAEATSPKAVAELDLKNRALKADNEDLRKKPVAGAVGRSADIDELLKPVVELLEAQLADKEVYTDPYRTGLANAFKLAIAAVKGEDVPEEELLTPLTQTSVKGARVLTGRQRLIKKAGEYVTLKGGRASLRTGLTETQIAEADDIMKRLGVEKGKYDIPAE